MEGYIMLLLFDYGHGGRDPGATAGKRKESEDVLKLGKAIAAILREKGLTIDETRNRDVTISLLARSNLEHKKKYDYFISFHRNAAKNTSASGAETFVYLTNNKKAKALATSIQQAMVNLGFKDRGVKQADFHVLRETYSQAILIEVGFITNKTDNELFNSKFDQLANEIATAIYKHCVSC